MSESSLPPSPFAPWQQLLQGASRRPTPRVRGIAANPHGKDYIVGDLHGCYGLLQSLLQHVRFRPSVDRLFSVGDLVDRGPQSFQCLQLLKEPWFYAVLGNHEWILLSHFEDLHHNAPYDAEWLKPFGTTYTQRKKWAQEWLPYLKRLPHVLRVGQGALRFNVVHAELLDEQQSVTDDMIDEWAFQDPIKAEHRCLWGRSLLQHWKARRPVKRAHHPLEMSVTYCGHTIVPDVFQLSQQVFLDRGAFLTQDTHQDTKKVLPEETQGRPVLESGLVLIQAHSESYWFLSNRPKAVVQTLAVKQVETL